MVSIDLVHNNYTSNESHDLIFELLDAKISLLGKKIHSQRERGLEVQDYETRHEYLVKTREELRQTLNALDGEEFKVRCQLTVDNA